MNENIIIVKNNTQNDIILSDLYNITIPASDQLNLTKYDTGERRFNFVTITKSDSLKQKILDGDITLNNGVKDLPASDGFSFLEILPTYHFIKNKDILILFNSKHYSYTSIRTNGVYTLVQPFLFRGSNTIGTPTGIKVVGYVSKSNGSAYVRITNSNTGDIIGTISNINSENIDIYTTEVINNVPTEECLLDIEAKVSNNRTLFISEVLIYY